MSDNVAITPGTGATVGADLIAGVLYQRIKPVWGVDGAQVDTSTTNPMPVDAIGTVALSATEVHVGQVGGTTQIIHVTPTIQATPDYSLNDCIGTFQTLTNGMRKSSGTGVIQSITVVDISNQKQPIDIIVLNFIPTGTFTDNSAPVWDSADYNRILGRIPIAAVDYVTYAGVGVATINPKQFGVWGNATANLYFLLIAGATINFASTSDLRLVFTILAD